MSKFASLTAGLLARKGEAEPVVTPFADQLLTRVGSPDAAADIRTLTPMPHPHIHLHVEPGAVKKPPAVKPLGDAVPRVRGVRQTHGGRDRAFASKLGASARRRHSCPRRRRTRGSPWRNLRGAGRGGQRQDLSRQFANEASALREAQIVVGAAAQAGAGHRRRGARCLVRAASAGRARRLCVHEGARGLGELSARRVLYSHSASWREPHACSSPCARVAIHESDCRHHCVFLYRAGFARCEFACRVGTNRPDSTERCCRGGASDWRQESDLSALGTTRRRAWCASRRLSPSIGRRWRERTFTMLSLTIGNDWHEVNFHFLASISIVRRAKWWTIYEIKFSKPAAARPSQFARRWSRFSPMGRTV